MSVKFFARFNLHNSVCENPPSVEFLRPHFNMSDAELKSMISEIDNVQKEAAERIKEQLPATFAEFLGKRVLFAGDSITSDNLGYRHIVARTLGLEGIDCSVSGGVSSMLCHTVKTKLLQNSPDIVSIMVGSNDSVCIDDYDFPQVSLCEYERNIGKIVKWAKNSGAKVLLFEIPPVMEESFKKSFDSQSKLQSNENIKRYNDILKRIADKNGIPLLSNDWLGGKNDFYMPDGIHLSATGQEEFAKRWISHLIY